MKNKPVFMFNWKCTTWKTFIERWELFHIVTVQIRRWLAHSAVQILRFIRSIVQVLRFIHSIVQVLRIIHLVVQVIGSIHSIVKILWFNRSIVQILRRLACSTRHVGTVINIDSANRMIVFERVVDDSKVRRSPDHSLAIVIKVSVDVGVMRR